MRDFPPNALEAQAVAAPASLARFREQVQSLLGRRLAKGQTISTADAQQLLLMAQSVLNLRPSGGRLE